MYKNESICKKCWKEWLERENYRLYVDSFPNYISSIKKINLDNYWQFLCPLENVEGKPISLWLTAINVIHKDSFLRQRFVEKEDFVPEDKCLYFLEQLIISQYPPSIGQVPNL